MKNIAVIYGSDSSEWEVSVRSGEFTASKIDHTLFNVYEIFARFGQWSVKAWWKGGERIVFPEGECPGIDKTDFSTTIDGVRIRFEFAYIMQHGTPGENGLIQGYLQIMNIPFSSCRSFVAAMTFDKFSSKSYLRDVPYVKCAPDIFLRKGQSVDSRAWVEKLGLPMFIKPTDGGSSFGVTKVKEEKDILPAIEKAFSEGGDMVIAEKAIVGREVTCAVYTDAGVTKALPIVEIVPHTEWFDYEAKYNGLSDEICPANLPDKIRDYIQNTSCRIYAQLGCAGLVRIDYILAEDGLYFLEINTIPGMTAASLVPRMVRTAGMDMTDFLTTIIRSRE